MVVGPLLVALGMLILTIPGRNANYFISFLPGLLFFGLGMSLVIAPLTKSALAVESRYSGAASGVNNAVSRIAGLLAVAVLSAIILLVFSTQLQQRMSTLTISQQAREKILIQENKLAGIEIPDGFSLPEKHATQEAIEDAFVYAFRGIMGINAGLAMLSAVIAYLTIPSKKHT
jgi:hypothetical protein